MLLFSNVGLYTMLMIVPALFIGYTLTDQLFQFLELGVSTKCQINIIEYQMTVFWQIGKNLK